MKIKKGFVLRQVAGQSMVIAIGAASRKFHGMIKLNTTGAEIWNGIQQGQTEEQIAEKLCEKFEVSYEKAYEDTVGMIGKMRDAGVLED